MAQLSWGGASSPEELGSLARHCSFCLSCSFLAFPATQVLSFGLLWPTLAVSVSSPGCHHTGGRGARAAGLPGVAVLLPQGDKTQPRCHLCQRQESLVRAVCSEGENLWELNMNFCSPLFAFGRKNISSRRGWHPFPHTAHGSQGFSSACSALVPFPGGCSW